MLPELYIMRAIDIETNLTIYKVGYSLYPVIRTKEVARERINRVKNVELLYHVECYGDVLTKEKYLHSLFMPYWVWGEWFDLNTWLHDKEKQWGDLPKQASINIDLQVLFNNIEYVAEASFREFVIMQLELVESRNPELLASFKVKRDLDTGHFVKIADNTDIFL